MSNVNVQRDLNRQARNAAKVQAVAAFQAAYLEVIGRDLTADFTDEARLIEAVTSSVAAYQAAYKAARNSTETVVGQESAAA